MEEGEVGGGIMERREELRRELEKSINNMNYMH